MVGNESIKQKTFDGNKSINQENMDGCEDIKQESLDEDIKQEIKIDIVYHHIQSLDYIKHEQHSKNPLENCNLISLSDVPITDNVSVKQENIKEEVGIVSSDCNQCIENYKGYCLKCSPLSHVLNNISQTKSEWDIKEAIPTAILEIRDIFESSGIFALKTLPKNVILGPFEGISAIECTNGWAWKIRNNHLENTENSNWMKYINYANSILLSNLEVLQFNGNLFFQTKREICEREELLVCFTDLNMENSSSDKETYYIPKTQERCQEIFACTLCCLGFSQDKHLFVHKTKFHNFECNSSVAEIIQCSLCDIWLEKQEYFKYHLDSCSASSSKKFRYPAVIDGLKIIKHIDIEEMEMDECSTKHDEFSPKLYTMNRDANKWFLCSKCSYKTIYDICLKHHLRKKHKVINAKIQCADGFFEINPKENLIEYKCPQCSYVTNRQKNLTIHRKRQHSFRIEIYKCTECPYKTSWKHHFQQHIKNKHCDGIAKDYKCSQCPYETNSKKSLEVHTKDKHSVGCEKDYKCAECPYETNWKNNMKQHIKSCHMDEIPKQFRTTILKNILEET